MHYTKNYDKRTGITYVYEAESYWDKEKKQPRNKRKLIGKIDEETGEIVPTQGRGRPRKDNTPKKASSPTKEKEEIETYKKQILDQGIRIRELEAEVEKLKSQRNALLEEMKRVLARYEAS